MSVIAAIYDNCNITLFADGQVTRPDGSIQTDYGDKLLQITLDVAVGYGGITGPCEEINKAICTLPIGKYFVEDVAHMIRVQADIVNTKIKDFIPEPSYAYLVCGRTTNNQIGVDRIECRKGNVAHKLYIANQTISANILPPMDMEQEQCNDMLANIVDAPGTKTIENVLQSFLRQISQNSNYVNTEHQSWTYSLKTMKSCMQRSWTI